MQCQKRRNSVFSKILLTFIAVIFPLYIFSAILNLWGQNDVRKEIAASEKSRIGFCLVTLENEIGNTLNLQLNMMNNPNLQQLVTNPSLIDEYDKYKAMNAIRTELNNLKEMSKFIEEASIYLPALNKKISNRFISGLLKEEYFTYKKTAEASCPFVMINNQYYISINESVVTNGHLDISYIILVKIKKTELHNMISKFSIYNRGGVLLVGNRDGWNMEINTLPQIIPYFKTLLTQFTDSNKNLNTAIFQSPHTKYLVSYEKSNLINAMLLVYVPEDQFLSSLTRYRTWLWVISILTLLIIVFFSYWIYGLIAKPMDKLLVALSKVEEGNLEIAVAHKSDDEFSFLYQRFNKLVDQLKNLIHQIYEEKITTQRAELKQLQYQINPHFLYNSFYLIYRMTRAKDYENLLKLTKHLGDYYQFNTRSAADDISVEDELKHVHNYLAIQNMRFSNRIRVEFINLLDDRKELRVLVPKLIFQPLIENAYNHGLKRKIKDGLLKITLSIQDNYLQYTVEDNGPGMNPSDLTALQQLLNSEEKGIECTALINIHRRLRIKYGLGNGLSVDRSELGGLKVAITIHISKGEVNDVPATNRG